MKGYKIFYNKEKVAFDMETEMSEVENVDGYKTYFWVDTLKHAKESVQSNNARLRNSGLKLAYCKDCGNMFMVTSDNIGWYIDRGFTEPKRCIVCTRKQKYVGGMR